MKDIILSTVFIILIPLIAYAEINNSDSYYDNIYKKAEQAMDRGDTKKADFWLARYTAMTFLDQKTEKNFTDLYPLFKKYDLRPTAFISGKYDEEFLEWFIFSTYARWGISDKSVDEEDGSFEISSASSGRYFVSIIAYPRLEAWYVIKEDGYQAVLTLGSFKNKPYILSGKLENGKPVTYFNNIDLDTGENFLHHVWTPEFHDLDNDGIPEIWIRYNLAWADGFSQVLAIYKIRADKELVSFKRFEGKAEGIARRLSNNIVEVVEGFASESGLGHLSYDKHHIETWKYRDEEFKKVSERDIPHILRSKDWKKYYLEN